MNQQEINFDKLFHFENSISNQEHFDRNKDRFSKQCKIVYEALLRGERLTTTKALIDYKIGDLRRRIKDLKDIWKVPISWEYKDGKYKEFFLIINTDKNEYHN